MTASEAHCEICGGSGGLDRHHVTPRRMGGSKNPAVTSEANLMTLCRTCHQNIHDGRWVVERSVSGVRVLDAHTGRPIMRRLNDPSLDVPTLFHLLNLAEGSFSRLLEAVPFLGDDQLVEAYAYSISFGKRSWLVQAAILYEAQKRSVYGDQTLEAIARRFDIGLRQAQKYALVWRVFFDPGEEGENVNIDAILLDEPSWYVIAATETSEPEKWLAYAQDRKMGDFRYSVAAFRREIQLTRLIKGIGDLKEAREDWDDFQEVERWACPWIRLLCTRSGQPTPYRMCRGCEFKSRDTVGLVTSQE